MRLRRDDPVGMKNFIISVQNRVNELKASESGQSHTCSKNVMLWVFLKLGFLISASNFY